MTDPIERVARARTDPSKDVVFRVSQAIRMALEQRAGTVDSDINVIALMYERAARMAIAALREPTEKMVDAAWSKNGGPLVTEYSISHWRDTASFGSQMKDDSAHEVWSVMIDALLKEG